MLFFIFKVNIRIIFVIQFFLISFAVQALEAGVASVDQVVSNLSDDLNGIDECSLVESELKLLDGFLSDYWAQELIGSDLLREDLKQYDPPSRSLAIFDDFADGIPSSHGFLVKALITNRGKQAILPLSQKQNVKIHPMYSKEGFEFIKVVNSYSSLDNPPAIINYSMGGFSEELEEIEALKSISSSTIFVRSAGNGAPNDLSRGVVGFAREVGAIIVGSSSPRGLVSSFSQEGEEVTILAPSDSWITLSLEGFDENHSTKKTFGGTSGAAPLVTGSLYAFEWLSGYHPTSAEAKMLLQKTALPSPHAEFEEPKENGDGILNTYKLGQVAKRIRENCKNKLKQQECFKQEIKNENNYQFKINDQKVLNQVKRAFPACVEEEQKERVSVINCSERKEAFKKLRQMTLLNNNSVEGWKALRCIYMEEGLSKNAEGVETIIATLTSKEELIKLLEKRLQNTESSKFTDEKEQISLFRTLRSIKSFDTIFKAVMENSHIIPSLFLINTTITLPEGERFGFLQQFAQSEHAYVRKKVAEQADSLTKSERDHIMDLLK